MDASLQVIGGKGAFTREISNAVLEGGGDLAVHSLKDLPITDSAGLRVWAYPERFDPRDAWIGRGGVSYQDLPPDARIATGSLRRAAQVRERYPTVTVIPIRGNVDTRLEKFKQGEMTGMILAMAGLQRLGHLEWVTEPLDPWIFVPAPGQGSLAVEGREDAVSEALLTPLNDPVTGIQAAAERAFLTELQADCQTPVGALATVDDSTVTLDGLVASPDGSQVVRGRESGPSDAAARVGRELAMRLAAEGGSRILDAIRENPS